MITDDQLSTFVNFLGITIVVLIVTYHFVAGKPKSLQASQ